MKEYMLIFIGEDYGDLELSPEEIGNRMKKWTDWVQRLTDEGVYVEGRPLLKQAKTLKRSKDIVLDGPYIESKEVVGGYFIIKAESMERAVEQCADFPDYDLNGSVEVREVMVY